MNRELSGVDADGDAARSSGDVVASQRTLAPFVEFAVAVQGERVRGDDGAFPELFEDPRS